MLYIAKTLVSRANGPGLRLVIWFKGCTLNCPGCINKHLQDPNGLDARGYSARGYSPAALFELVQAELEAHPEIEGITLSGGEPLQQDLDSLGGLCYLIHGDNLSVMLFTGYSTTEILANTVAWYHAHDDSLGHPPAGPLYVLEDVDILVAGRYEQGNPSDKPLLASANQEVIFLSDRYSPADLENIPREEIHVDLDGGPSIITGFPKR